MGDLAEHFDPARGVHVLRVDNPAQLAAEARAKLLIEQAQLNEAIRVVTDLISEVQKMPISARFRRDRRPSESPYAGSANPLNPLLRGLDEAEFKRQTLLARLASLGGSITLAVGQLEGLVLDIEATKTDWNE